MCASCDLSSFRWSSTGEELLRLFFAKNDSIPFSKNLVSFVESPFDVSIERSETTLLRSDTLSSTVNNALDREDLKDFVIDDELLEIVSFLSCTFEG
jgi:hypothetical protein